MSAYVNSKQYFAQERVHMFFSNFENYGLKVLYGSVFGIFP